MAQFYGTVKGQRGEASRLGTKQSGLTVRAASYQGALVVHLWHDVSQGKDRFEVRMEQHHGAGDYRSLASGIVGDYRSLASGIVGDQSSVQRGAPMRASDQSSVQRGAPILPLDMGDTDLVALATNSGAQIQGCGESITFTFDELREFLKQAMAHVEVKR